VDRFGTGARRQGASMGNWSSTTPAKQRPKTAAQVRKEAVDRYFRPTPDTKDRTVALTLLQAGGGVCLLAVAILAVQLPIALAAAVLLLGVVVVLQGWERLARYNREFTAADGKPTDGEMDGYLQADLKKIAQHALRRLDLHERDLELTSEEVDPTGGRRLAEQGSGPVTVFGPVLTSSKCIGLDEVWRFGAYDVMVICPTAYHVGIFECTLDIRTGGRRSEEVREYHYADVVMVSLVNNPPADLSLNPLDRAGRLRSRITRAVLCELQIAVSSGDRSSIVVGITGKEAPQRTVRLQESGLDRVVATLRRRLREKKSQVLGVGRPRQ
jgi:hypothetical protein